MKKFLFQSFFLLILFFAKNAQGQAPAPLVFQLINTEILSDGIRYEISGFFFDSLISVDIGGCPCDTLTGPQYVNDDKTINCKVFTASCPNGANGFVNVVTPNGSASSFFSVVIPDPSIVPLTVNVTADRDTVTVDEELSFTLAFSEPITGLDVSDFNGTTITTNGATTSIAIDSLSGDSLYRVRFTVGDMAINQVSLSLAAGIVTSVATGAQNLVSDTATVSAVGTPKFTMLGQLEVGDTVYANPADIDSIGGSISYRWFIADDENGANETLINGETNSYYIFSIHDTTKFISLEATVYGGKVLRTPFWGAVAEPEVFGAGEGITGPYLFEIKSTDVPDDSPIQLNSTSLGLLVPALNTAYPNADIRIQGRSTPSSLTLRKGDFNSDYIYKIHVYAYNSLLLNYEEAFVMEGFIQFNGAYQDSADVFNAPSMAGVNFATVNIKSSNIGTINTFLLKFRLNLASIGLITAYNPIFINKEYNSPFASGSGEKAKPFQIDDVGGLQALKFFGEERVYAELIEDIDASATQNWNQGRGFEPIGNLVDDCLTSLDGNGHIVSDLYINRPNEDNVALFGRTAIGNVSAAEEARYMVTQLGLANANITGKDKVAGLIAETDPGNFILHRRRISESFVKGTITGSNDVGGLLGKQFAQDTLTIENCYSWAKVSGNNSGLLLGAQDATAQLELINSYSSSNSNTTDALLGFGSSSNTIVNNSYYNSDSASIAVLGSPLTTSQLMDENNLTSWDFDSTWIVSPYLNSGLPQLLAFVNLPAVSTAADSLVNVNCNGDSSGYIEVNIAGGLPPYQLLWENGDTTLTRDSLKAGNYTLSVVDDLNDSSEFTFSITEPVILLAATVVDSNVSCNGFFDGGATASATGGAFPYTYLWSNSATSSSITGVPAGMYSVTVTDVNGCEATSDVTITEPAALSALSIVDSNVSCNGFFDGGATASATGGTAPYSYLWNISATNASITGVAAGTYSVTITDANGCSASSNVTITEPAILSALSVVDSNVSCNGFTDGGASASASGGTPPYNYLWSNGANNASITGVAAGTYSVTVTDFNGCSASNSITVTEPTALLAASIVDSNVSCNGFTDGGATALATGGIAPYAYLWSNSATSASITGVAAGMYSVTVTDNRGCAATSNVTITEPAVLMAASIVDSNVSCNGFFDGGATASATGGTAPYTYLWNNSATNSSITGVAAGTYTVTITDANGCSDASSITITEPLPLSISSSTIKESSSGNDGTIDATVIGGTPPYNYNWSPGGQNTEDLNGISGGDYTLTVTDFNGCTLTSDTITVESCPTISLDTITINHVTCRGGTDGGVSVSASGGAAPYSLTIQNGSGTFTNGNVPQGTYTLIVTDANGCTATQNNLTISEPQPLDGGTITSGSTQQ